MCVFACVWEGVGAGVLDGSEALSTLILLLYSYRLDFLFCRTLKVICIVFTFNYYKQYLLTFLTYIDKKREKSKQFVFPTSRKTIVKELPPGIQLMFMNYMSHFLC